ncbi:hypothetical protein [Brachybacterium sp. P6-10-X1]|uniref:hypothetical protein n=1 Tax=Brachybacterium sp. P6-10-X1 TaxID=1903186 RepID=UPI001C12C821|nr:hypothetical protein [Brachybacterium sp. P6-10-X1]
MDEDVDAAGPVGEAACWLGLLCPECGAMPEEDGARDPGAPCWRCGAVRAQHTEADESPEGA